MSIEKQKNLSALLIRIGLIVLLVSAVVLVLFNPVKYFDDAASLVVASVVLGSSAVISSSIIFGNRPPNVVARIAISLASTALLGFVAYWLLFSLIYMGAYFGLSL